MSLLLYNIFLLLYSIGAGFAAMFNRKARAWVKGRKGLMNHIAVTLENNTTPVIWMHCASLGEFEQGRPLLERIKNDFPSYKIVLTFFSPSGYEVRKNYAGADWIFYLPQDGKKNAARFVQLVKPSLVLWVKYEYWYYYLTELKRQHVPVLLVSGIFRKSQPFFKWYGGMWRNILASFHQLFVQTETSVSLLGSIKLHQKATLSGDTRFDRVIDIAEQSDALPWIQDFCRGHKVIVAGSTWDDDEAEWIHYAKAHPEIKFIIAPHEVDDQNIRDVQASFEGSALYSSVKADPSSAAAAHIIIIDNIGMLSRLYFYADITYVGGGFNDSGIHNVLEAAVYGKPVIFGPEYEKFAEAVALIACGGAFTIESAVALEKLLNKLFNEPDALTNTSKASKAFVYGHRGATAKIMEYVYANRLLTS